MLANTRQSWILDPIPWIQDSGCWIPVFSGGISFLSRVLELYSGFQSPGFRIPYQKFSRIPDPTSKNFPDSGIRIPLRGAKYKSNIFWPVHAYLIKQWEIYFSSNVRFYNMMDRSNFWSMQLFQTGPHFKLEEVWFWKGIFPSWHNRLNTNVQGSEKLNEAWKVSFTCWTNFWTIYTIGKGKKGILK